MKNKAINLLKSFLPSNRAETIIFLVSFIVYSCLALYVALGTNITDQTYPMRTDAYFSFDNPYYSHYGIRYNEAHPWAFLIIIPLLYIGIIFNFIFGIKGKACFLVIICSLFIALSTIYIYRYLSSIINLSKFTSILLTIFYAGTSTCLILSFTFETYTFSIFFLTYALYYYSVHIKHSKEIPLLKGTILAFILGGLTTTNLVKGILPLFFTTNKFSKFIKQGLFIGGLFLVIALFLSGFKFLDQIIGRTSDYIPTNENWTLIVFIYFWGSPILFSNFKGYIIDNIHSVRFIDFAYGENNSWIYYIATSILLFIVVYSIIVNIKNKNVQLLLSFFVVDIIIHAIIKYGGSCLFIYGGHWIFVVPLLLGWAYKASNKKGKNILAVSYCILTVILLINNGYWIMRFIQIAKELYPA